MTLIKFVQLWMLIVLGFSARLMPADSFGITFSDQGICTGCPGRSAVNLQNAPLVSYSDNFSQSGIGGALADFSGSIDNGALHAYSQINTGSSFDGNSEVGMDAYFFDTFQISGPAGQSGQFDITLNFDGSGETTGTAAVGDYVNTYNLLENGTVIPGIQYTGIVSTLAIPFGASATQKTSTIHLTLASGSSVTLGELLQIRSAMINEGGSGAITIDDSNTGYFTVTPVTQGFGFTTASGLTYSQNTVPEPSSGSLLGSTLLITIAAAARFLNRGTAKSAPKRWVSNTLWRLISNPTSTAPLPELIPYCREALAANPT